MVLVFLAFGIIGLLAGCGAVNTEKPSETVTLAMGFVPNVQFAPFYVAVEKGYFGDEGIQLEFDYGWETDLLKLVGSDELQFAIGSGDQVILARSQGLPVVYVMNWYRRFPVCVMSLPEAGIQEPADLVERRVGTPATYGASYIGFKALLNAGGLSEEDVTLDAIGFTQAESLANDIDDAVVVYISNEPIKLAAEGYQVTTLASSDYISLVANGLVTSESVVTENPELVRSMVHATLKGIQYTIDNPEEAFTISEKYVENLAALTAEEKDVQRQVLDASIALWKADPLGYSDPTAWENMQDLLLQMELLSCPVELERAFTNDFLPQGQ